MTDEKMQLTLTVNQALVIAGLILTMVVALFGAAGWVVSRLDRLEESIRWELRNLDGRIDELSSDVSRMQGQLDSEP